MCSLKNLSASGECPPLLNKKHTFLVYQMIRSGLSEAPSAEHSAARAACSSHGSCYLRMPSNQPVLGDTPGCHGVTKLPVFSRGLINANLKEDTPWIKPSQHRTWLLANFPSVGPAVIPFLIINHQNPESEDSAATAT